MAVPKIGPQALPLIESGSGNMRETSSNVFCHRIKDCLQRLATPNAKDQMMAALDLVVVGIQQRERSGPRGRVDSPALLRSPLLPDLALLEKRITDADTDVREAVIAALGEWGDKSTVKLLDQLLYDQTAKPEPVEVRVACVLAMGNIGGFDAVNSLACIANSDESPKVRLSAIQAVEELATYTSELNADATVDCRGKSEVKELSSAIKDLTAMAQDAAQPEDLRYQAARALGVLKTT